MQNKSIKSILKATIFNIIVAFFIVITVSLIFVRFGKEKFLMATNLINMLEVSNNSDIEKTPPVLQTVEDKSEQVNESKQISILTNCPEYGSQYATLKIPSVGVELPIYYGKTLDLLKNGVGHDNDSYFPGEGGSIILMGHNFSRFLAKMPNAKIGDEIQIITNYGEFHYNIYDAQIVEETDTDKVPIQKSEEILMIYTCWPINNIGYTTKRYVVYAK